MIVEIGNMLVYLPLTDGYDSLMTRFMKRETDAFENCFGSDMTIDIFVVVAPKNLKQSGYHIARILLEYNFEYQEPEFGAGYWIKERPL